MSSLRAITIQTSSQQADVNGDLIQCAALCHRRDTNSNLEFLLITSRRTGRWITPKGWPMAGKSLAETAAQEAWEEIGARGLVEDRCLGTFRYDKYLDDGSVIACAADIYPLAVTHFSDDFPEKGEREKIWLRAEPAAARVRETALKDIIHAFDQADTTRETPE